VPKEDGPVHQERGSPQLSLPNANNRELPQLPQTTTNDRELPQLPQTTTNDREPPQLAQPNTNGWEPQEGYLFQLPSPNEVGRDAQETQEKIRKAAITQLRQWAQSHGFDLPVGHSKRGKEWKGMSSKLSECLFNISVLSFSNSVISLIVRLDCKGKGQRKGPYPPGQHASSSSNAVCTLRAPPGVPQDPPPQKRGTCTFHINIRSSQRIAPNWEISRIPDTHSCGL